MNATHAYTLRGPSTKECPKTTPGTRYPHRSVLDTALPVLNSVARQFGAATHAVIAMILDRNSAAIPRGLIQARNVLANLGKKHNKATLEPACQQVLDKKLAPTMAVIKRIQTDIAHAQQHPGPPGAKPQPVAKHHPRPSTPLTGEVADAVFIRPADHYEN